MLVLVGAVPIQAAVLTLYTPTVGSTNVGLDMEATNDNTGAIYNSADLNLTSELASGLWALEANQTAYATMQDMIADWDMNIRTPPTGEVYVGWNFSAQSNGGFELMNVGGFIDFDHDGWYSTSADPTSDTQAYTLLIPKSQLELDGTPGYNPLTDASIVLSGAGNTMSDAFVATQDIDNTYQAESQYFTVQVPEPSVAALLAGVMSLLPIVMRRRRMG